MKMIPSALIYLGIMLVFIIVWFVLLKRPVYEALLLSFVLLVAITGTWGNVWTYIDGALNTSLLFSMIVFVAMSQLLTETKVIDSCVFLIISLLGRIPGGAGYASVIASSFMEAILYGLILTSGGKLLIWSEFISIVLCFLFALSMVRRETMLLTCGLAFTVCADFCLVLCDPIQQLGGMIFFSCTQICYWLKLQHIQCRKSWMIARIVLILAVEAVSVCILKENTDPLALVSMFYYVNLVMNMVESFIQFHRSPLFAIGLVFFILCDTVVGLQVAAGGYLPIPEGSFIHKLIFSGFHLSWFFYLPSQVLIALSGRRK